MLIWQNWIIVIKVCMKMKGKKIQFHLKIKEFLMRNKSVAKNHLNRANFQEQTGQIEKNFVLVFAWNCYYFPYFLSWLLAAGYKCTQFFLFFLVYVKRCVTKNACNFPSYHIIVHLNVHFASFCMSRISYHNNNGSKQTVFPKNILIRNIQ